MFRKRNSLIFPLVVAILIISAISISALEGKKGIEVDRAFAGSGKIRLELEPVVKQETPLAIFYKGKELEKLNIKALVTVNFNFPGKIKFEL